MLNYEFPPLGGGASPVSYEIAKGYVRLGHRVTVVTMGYRGLPKHEVKDGIEIYRVPCLRSKKEICHPWEQLTYNISAKRFLRKHLKHNHYDINHTHFIIPTGIVSLWVKKKFGIPYIITSHGSDVPGYNKDRFKFLHKFTKPILNVVCRDALIVTVPSNSLRNLILKNINPDLKKKTIVLPNGSSDFYMKGIKKENIIVSSGRMHVGKGFQYIIRAFNELNPESWKLFLLGDGPYKKELVKNAKGNPNIIFTGWINNNTKRYRSILNKAKIFVLLSEFESQGIVYLEAMSAGCAILASNISACKETVSPNVGYLVNRKNIAEIKKKLKELMYDDVRLNQMMSKARKRYEDNYKWDKIIKKYEALLR
ncbi:MAG: L-malate glycosyltransferase [Candidatus Woesearchaeota archaeon]|nr:L-malate glycosyltransferase [Candidatus Woesearchaeota archaeon]